MRGSDAETSGRSIKQNNRDVGVFQMSVIYGSQAPEVYRVQMIIER